MDGALKAPIVGQGLVPVQLVECHSEDMVVLFPSEWAFVISAVTRAGQGSTCRRHSMSFAALSSQGEHKV